MNSLTIIVSLLDVLIVIISPPKNEEELAVKVITILLILFKIFVSTKNEDSDED